MSLAEILAKKKALAAGNNSSSSVTEEKKLEVNSPSPLPTTIPSTTVATPKTVEQAPAPAPTEQSKPLTFAEKLALKRKQDAEALAQKKAESTSNAAPVEELAVLSPAPVQESIAKAERAPVEIQIVSDDPEIQQKYADIKNKILDLEDKMGDDLKSAMTALKKSLHDNAEACAHMLDEDIGQMVVALRRMTMQDVIESKEGSGKKKPKATTMRDLTAEQLMAGIEEL